MIDKERATSLRMPPDKPRIPLENYFLSLKQNIKLLGVSDIIEEWHAREFDSYSRAARAYGISSSCYRTYIRGEKGLSIWLLKTLFSKNRQMLDTIYMRANYCQVGTDALRIPRYLSPRLAYYIGYLQGDGFIEPSQKRVAFFDQNLEQLQLINALTKSIFGRSGRFYKRKNENTNCLYIGSVFVNSFLSQVFRIKRGKRKFNQIPPKILLNQELLRWYICGLFDAESAMPKQPLTKKSTYIDIAMKDTKLIKKLKKLLMQRFGVFAYGPYSRKVKVYKTLKINPELELRIRKHSEIKKFLSNIGTIHPDKIKRKESILNLLGP